MSSIGFILLTAFVFIFVFYYVWIGVGELGLAVYIVVFLILLFLTYMFLNGVRYITRVGKKIGADVCSLDIFDDEQFYAVFHLCKPEIDKKKHFIFRYEIDGAIQYELQYKRALWDVKIGGKEDIYVISHKEGVKTAYEIRTSQDIARNLAMGIPFAIELIAWVILFIMRGL